MNEKIFGLGRACAKFILIGEHFVVHGESPAIAFPLTDINTVVNIKPYHVFKIEASYQGFSKNSENETEIKSLIHKAYNIACDALRINLSSQPMFISSKSNFPVSRGFGSSASFSVSLAKALLDLRYKIQKNWELTDPYQELEQASFKIEKLFHGSPSGVDTTVILNEKPIFFKRTKINNEFKNEFNFIKNECVEFILVDSGERKMCAQKVMQITELKNNNPKLWEKYALKTEKLCLDVLNLLSQKIAVLDLSLAINEAHSILKELNLSTECIEEIILRAKNLGALAGKVSGAGGGGAVVIITRPNESLRIANELRKYGYNTYVPAVNENKENEG